MTAAASIASAPGAARPTLLERQLAMLDELAEIAMAVARAAGREAAEGPADPKGPDPTLAFSRAARAVRLTLLLQTRLVEGPAAGRGAPPVSREARMARARAHVERLVREAHGEDPDVVDRLSAEGAERLEEEEGFDELPMGQVVALICSDLRLAPAVVERALSLFDPDDARLPPPAQGPADGWEVQWLGAPPRPRRRAPPEDPGDGTGPPPRAADRLA